MPSRSISASTTAPSDRPALFTTLEAAGQTDTSAGELTVHVATIHHGERVVVSGLVEPLATTTTATTEGAYRAGPRRGFHAGPDFRVTSVAARSTLLPGFIGGFTVSALTALVLLSDLLRLGGLVDDRQILFPCAFGAFFVAFTAFWYGPHPAWFQNSPRASWRAFGVTTLPPTFGAPTAE